jgi:hypothetical protein
MAFPVRVAAPARFTSARLGSFLGGLANLEIALASSIDVPAIKQTSPVGAKQLSGTSEPGTMVGHSNRCTWRDEKKEVEDQAKPVTDCAPI